MSKLLKELDVITKEAGILADYYEMNMNVLTSIITKESITTETAIAYIEPLLGYDMEQARTIVANELTVESGEGATGIMKALAWIIENINKIVNLFKNMFKAAYSKYVLFTNNINKRAKKLEDGLSKINFAEGSEFSADDIKSIANQVGILAYYNDTIDKNAIGGILNIKDAIVPLDNYLTGYSTLVKQIANNFKDMYNKTNGGQAADEAIANKLYLGFVGTLQATLFSSKSDTSKIFKNKSLFTTAPVDGNNYLMYGFSNNTLNCINAKFDMTTLQTNPSQFGKDITIKLSSFTIDSSIVAKKIKLDPLNSNELKELLSSLTKYDFKGHIDKINTAFNGLSNANKEAIKDLSLSGEYVQGKNEIIGIIAQVTRIFNSSNFNTFNATVFTHINQTARLLSNLLSFAELNMKKFKGGETIVSEARANSGKLLLENK